MNHNFNIKIYLTLLVFLAARVLCLAQQKSAPVSKVPPVDTVKSKSINTAYGTQDVGLISESISTIKGTDLQKTFNTNLGNILIGRMAGLTITPGNNEPGINSPGIFSRGLSTFANGGSIGSSTTVGSSTAPLVIVDGFISDFYQLLPEEIEEISLLKDASATAMYGMRAANGVLLVTTKRGKKGPLKINLSTLQGFSQATFLPTFLDSYGYASLYNEAQENDGKPRKYTADDLSAYLNNTDPVFHPNVNWYNQVLQKTAPLANYNINFSGGDENVKYFVLLNAINQQGLLRNFGDQDSQSSNSTYNRYNFRTNLDVNITKNFSVALTFGGTIEDKANPAAYNTGGILGYIATLPPNSFPVYNPNGAFSGTTSLSNPVATLLKTGFYSTNGRTLESSLRLNEHLDMIAKGLNASAAISTYSYFTSYSNKSKQIQLSILGQDASGNPTYSTTGTTTSLVGSETQSDQYRNLALQGQLSYDHTFGKNKIQAQVVFNSDTYTISYAANPIDGLTSAPYNHNTLSDKLSYTFDNKYTAQFTSAYMGSGEFAPGRRYGFFPAGSLGWIMSNENFLKDNPIISFLKLRGSYGLTGNDNINATRRYLFDPYVAYVSQYNFGTSNTSYFSLAEAASNPFITWERQRTTNIGLDATFFKNINFSIDYFKNDRSSILVSSTNVTPQYLGTPITGVNQGRMTNSGFETTIRYNSSATTAVQYFFAGNLSYAKNKIIYNAEAAQVNGYQLQAGLPYGQIRGYVANGFYTSAQDIQNSPKPVGVAVQPGDIKYRDLGGPNGVPDGVIDQYDTKVIGNSSLPQWTAGLNTGVSYKSFDVNVVLEGVTGNNIYFGNSYTNAFQGSVSQVSVLALNRWTPATAATATYPRLSTNGNQNNYQTSSFWVKNAEFIKMRSAEIGYTFSKALVSKIKIANARLFLQGTNLFSLNDMGKYGGDPESSVTGYPPLRVIALGLKVQL